MLLGLLPAGTMPWVCELCTYRDNTDAATVCEVCDGPGPPPAGGGVGAGPGDAGAAAAAGPGHGAAAAAAGPAGGAKRQGDGERKAAGAAAAAGWQANPP